MDGSILEFKLKKLFLLAAMLLPLFAHAACQCDEDEPDDDGIYRQYDYFGLKGGTGHYQSPGVQGGSNSYGAFYGHRYSKYFAAEVEYTFLGKYVDAASAGHATAVSVTGVHLYDLTENFALVGKVGVAFTHTANAPSFGKNATDLVYGIGFDWRLSRDWYLRSEINRYWLKMPENTRVANTFVGLAYRF